MECDICLTEWNLSNNIPKILNCGHTYCKTCLIDMFNTCIRNTITLNCPTCKMRILNISNLNDITNLMNNKSLIQLIERKDNRSKLVYNFNLSASNFFTQTGQSMKSLDAAYLSSIKRKENILISAFNDKKCKIHNQQMIGYKTDDKNNKDLLCIECYKNTDKYTNITLLKETIKNIEQRLFSLIEQNEIISKETLIITN